MGGGVLRTVLLRLALGQIGRLNWFVIFQALDIMRIGHRLGRADACRAIAYPVHLATVGVMKRLTNGIILGGLHTNSKTNRTDATIQFIFLVAFRVRNSRVA